MAKLLTIEKLIHCVVKDEPKNLFSCFFYSETRTMRKFIVILGDLLFF